MCAENLAKFNQANKTAYTNQIATHYIPLNASCSDSTHMEKKQLTFSALDAKENRS